MVHQRDAGPLACGFSVIFYFYGKPGFRQIFLLHCYTSPQTAYRLRRLFYKSHRCARSDLLRLRLRRIAAFPLADCGADKSSLYLALQALADVAPFRRKSLFAFAFALIFKINIRRPRRCFSSPRKVFMTLRGTSITCSVVLNAVRRC